MMKYSKILTFVLGATLALTSCVREESVNVENTPTVEESYIAGEIFVKFSPEVADLLEESGAVRSTITRSGVSSVDELLDIIGGFEISRVFPVDKRHEERTVRDGLNCWYIVRYSNKYTAEEVSRRFSQLGEVQKVDVNRTIKRANTKKATPLSKEAYAKMSASTRALQGTFNDALYAKQWNVENDGAMAELGGKAVAGADVQVVEAWKKTTGDSSVIVAVLDEGIDIEHDDLKANIWVNPNENGTWNDDQDSNGYKGDKHGYNFVSETGKITWNGYYDSGHGTHVAGTIAAVNNNGIGVASIAGGDGSADSGVKVMVCQIFSGNVSTGLLNVVRAMKYAADNGAVVMQCSWGYVSGAVHEYEWGPAGYASEEEWIAGSPIEKEALDYFINNAGSPNGVIEGGIAIFAAGNENAPMAGFPGAAEYCISVAATSADFTPATYTNYGPGTNISAPGGDIAINSTSAEPQRAQILSTLPKELGKGEYGYMQGTSMACPHVSGVVALGLSYALKLGKTFTHEEFLSMIYTSVNNVDFYVETCEKKINGIPFDLTPYLYNTGTGSIDAWRLLMQVEGTPNMLVQTGKDTKVALNQFFGPSATNLTYTPASKS